MPVPDQGLYCTIIVRSKPCRVERESDRGWEQAKTISSSVSRERRGRTKGGTGYRPSLARSAGTEEMDDGGANECRVAPGGKTTLGARESKERFFLNILSSSFSHLTTRGLQI